MSLMSLIIAVVVTGGVVVFTLMPLLARQPGPPGRVAGPRGTTRQNQALETLQAERLRVLRAIRDLDFDFDLNKVPDEVYASQRVYLIRLWAAITLRSDELSAGVADQAAQINAAVRAFRAAQARGSAHEH
jgi:hypothetical protein